MPVERITEAEYAVEPGNEHYVLDANVKLQTCVNVGH